MIEITIMLLVFAVVLTVIRIFYPKSEMNWFCFIMGIMAMCAVLIDDTLEGNQVVLALMPAVFVTMMGGLAVMGYGRRA